MSMYLYYYNDQIGGGIRNIYVGAPRQRGHGVGGWLGGLIRTIAPYIRNGAKAVGKEAARAGVQILGDVSRGDMSLHDSVRMRSRESGRKLAKKASEKLSDIMKGRGYKARRRRGDGQSKKKRSSIRRVKNKTIKRSNRKKLKSSIKKKQSANKKRKNIKRKRDISDIFA
uniref:N-acetyltransferase domain-containing protein n=1 Tax=Trichogramma kaykai TaxID=54128 RepID=A0ABD2X0Q3_9HYME